MARAALSGRLTWQLGRVVETIDETAEATSLVLDLPRWRGHRAGQHVDVRLTAEGGYQAQRSYSIGSAPEDDALMVTIERLDGGEVSPYLTDVVEGGDELELRGPIGGYFAWDASLPGPLLLVAGGAGIVPFRAMLRHWVAVHRPVDARLLYSARSLDRVIYRDELLRLAAYDEVDVRIALTRKWPPGWRGHRGRVDRDYLEAVAWPPSDRPRIFVCGPTGFVDAAATALVESGHLPDSIKTERFGPTGGCITDALDGNAIAGELFAAFSREMTAETGTCRNCGAMSAIAELRVYTRAPGAVARCPGCDAVVMVLVTVAGTCAAHLPAFELSA